MTFHSMAAVYILVCAIFLSENEIQSQFAFCTVDDPDDAGTNEKGTEGDPVRMGVSGS